MAKGSIQAFRKSLWELRDDLGRRLADEARQLRRVRPRGGPTPADFGGRIGVDPKSVENWFNPKKKSWPRAEMLICIATTFGVTLDWLLGGEKAGPKYPDQRRKDSDLEQEVAAYAVREGLQAVPNLSEPWLREMLPRLVNPRALMQYMVRAVAEDLSANAESFRLKAAAAREISAVTAGVAAGKPVDAEGVLDILKRLFATPPPAGRIVEWMPVTFTPPGLPVPRRSSKAKSPARRKK